MERQRVLLMNEILVAIIIVFVGVVLVALLDEGENK
jgi:hypothetical protein